MKKGWFVASHKSVFNTPLFWMSLLLPVTCGLTLAIYIGIAESLEFSLSKGIDSVELFWEFLKVPITIASLSIPLASWVIANHRSAQLVETINKQEEKRLYDLFYDHSNYFVSTFGRLIKTHKWAYLEQEDLPIIHRQLFIHCLNIKTSNFHPDPIVLDSIKSYLRNMSESYELFINNFESLSNEGNGTEIDNYCYRFIEFARDRTMTLVRNLGSKPIFPDESLHISLAASMEAAELYKWINPVFEMEEDFVNIDASIPNKVGSLIMEHFQISSPEDLKPSIIKAHTIIRDINPVCST